MTGRDDPGSKRPQLAAAAWLVGLFGMALAALGSWRPAISPDEAATISATTRSWSQLVELTQQIDAVHLAYYALLKPWFAVVGVNAVTLRFPSALLVGLSGVLVVWLATNWLPRSGALAAGLLAVVLPRATHIGSEGRSWALVSVLVLLATGCLIGWRRNWRAGWLIGYGVVIAAGIVVEVYLVFVFVAHASTLLWLRTSWRRLGQFALVGLAAVGLATPIIVRAIGQSGQIATDAGLQFATWLRQLVINQSFAGEPLGVTGWLGELWRPAAVVLAIVGWALVGRAMLRARQPVGTADSRAALAWCLPLLVLPSVLVAGWSWAVGSNMYNPRYFSFSYAPMAICMVLGLAGLQRRQLVAIATAGAVALLPGYLGQRSPTAKSDWLQVTELIAAEAQPGDGIFFAAQPSTRPIAIAYPAPFAELIDISLDQSPAQAGTLSGTNLPLTEVISDAGPRVWGIWRVDDDQLDADRAVFEQAGYQQQSQWVGSLDVVIYFERPNR